MSRVVAGRVSVVVPTRNSARTLERCLQSVRHQRDADVELIVVDNGSTDDTRRIAAALADRVEECGPERSAQRNRGWAVSSGEHVLFLDSDQALERGVAADAVRAFAADSRTGALVIPELAHGEGFLAACRELEKRLYLGDRRVEAARIFRRSALERCGGYDEELTGNEDWELPDRLEAAGYRVGRVRSRVWHDEGRVRLRDAFRKKRYYGRGSARYLDRPGRRRLLRTVPLRGLPLLTGSPLRAAGLVLLKAIEGAGLAAGIAEGRQGAALAAAAPGGVLAPAPPAERMPRANAGEEHLPAAEPVAAPADRRPRAALRRRALAYGIPVGAALLASLTWFRPGRFIAGGDVSPFLRDNLAGELFSSWTHQLTGAGSTSYEMARAADVAALWLAGLAGLSAHVAQHAFIAACFALAAFGAAFLAGAVVRRPAAIAAAGLVGAFNPFVLTTLPNVLPLLAGGLLGVLAGLLWRHAQGRHVPAVVLAAVTLGCSYLAVNPPLLAILLAGTLAAAASAGLVAGPGGGRRALLLLLRAAPWALLLNLWWLLPLAQSTIGGGAGFVLTAQTDVASWGWSHARASLANVAMLNAHWGWNHAEYFPYAAAMERGAWPALAWLLPVGAALGALTARGRRRRLALALAAAALVLIFVGKGLHDPLGSVNAWLYETVPGLWLLRDPMSKVGVVLVLLYATLVALGVERALGALAGRRLRVAGWGALALGVSGAVAASWPLWTGAVMPADRAPLPGVHVRVPADWTAAAAVVNRSPVAGKALVLPLNTYYQVTTSWGYHGVDAIPQQLLRRPVIQRLPGGYFGETPGFDALLTQAQAAIARRDARATRGALRALGVSHVIVRTDVDAASQPAGYADAARLQTGLGGIDGLRRTARLSVGDVFEVEGAAGAVRAVSRLEGVARLDARGGAAAVAQLPSDSAAAAVDAAPLDALSREVGGARAAFTFDLARGGEYRIDRRHAGSALYRAELGPRGVTLTDAATLRLDAVPLLERPPLKLELQRPAAALEADGRLLTLAPGALVALDGGPVTPYAVAGSERLRGFSALEDCARHDDRTPSEAGLSLRRPAPGTIRLAARAHSACTWAPIAAAPFADAYRLRLSYHPRAGAPARVCVWQVGPDRCAELPSLAPSDGGWRSYHAAFVPAPGTTDLRLYLYADGTPARTEIDFRALAVDGLEPGSAATPKAAPVAEAGRAVRQLSAGTHRMVIEQPLDAAPRGALSDLEDCGASDARTPAEAGLSLRRLADGVVELGARAHIACAWTALPDAGPAGLTRVAFEHRALSGRPARVCVWELGPDRCAELPPLAAGGGWQRFSTVLRTDPGTTGLRLYLYADGQDEPPTRVQYRDLTLEPVVPTRVGVRPVGGAAPPAPAVDFSRERADRYRAEVRGADGPFTLVLAESWAEGWSLDGLPAGWTAEHVRVDGYANGWRIQGSGDATLSLSYEQARWGRAALAVAALAALIALAGAGLAGFRARGRSADDHPPRRLPDHE